MSHRDTSIKRKWEIMKNLSNENIIHKSENGIEYIQFKKMLEYPEIEHCYTIRNSDLNFRIYESDNILQKSYDKICSVLDFDRNKIVKTHQTHTDKVEVVSEVSQIFYEVDGILTDKKGIVLCTTSADCTSLLFYDPIKKIVGDVHSGWRGTLQKIGQKAVNIMIEQYGCNSNDIICCICPHIRRCHFEVEEDVMKMFKHEFEYAFENKMDRIIILGEKKNGVQKYYIDTTLINKLILEEIGLLEENIVDSGICTVCESEYFHSYRVDKEKAGRNAAMIAKK